MHLHIQRCARALAQVGGFGWIKYIRIKYSFCAFNCWNNFFYWNFITKNYNYKCFCVELSISEKKNQTKVYRIFANKFVRLNACQNKNTNTTLLCIYYKIP